MRKPIAVIQTDPDFGFAVICDDGTVWSPYSPIGESNMWRELVPPIPGTEADIAAGDYLPPATTDVLFDEPA